MLNGGDPLEERDIQKILDALDDPRVVERIANALAIKIHKISFPVEGPNGPQSFILQTETAYEVVSKSKLKEENQS